MQIIRFIDDQGQIRLGQPADDSGTPASATLLAGDVFNPVITGRRAVVARLLAPLVPVNIFCIGANYAAHAREAGRDVPDKPIIFMKPTSAVNDPEGVIRIPACSNPAGEVDYEGELAVIIGKPARNVPQEQALDYVLGYTCANDVSARHWQKQGGGNQWIRGKGFDTFCPLGPVLVTADEIPDPQQLAIRTTISGETLQQAPTSDMIFTVAFLVSYLSQDVTLLPGTVILTGTPEGVGAARKPQRWLVPGDVAEVTIDRIGTLRNPVVGPTG